MSTNPVQLTSLIAYVRESEPDSGPLDRVEAACRTAADLEMVGDHLLGHFVDEAREAGLSWTQIGERIGITKQAARKRFAPRDVPEEPATLKQRVFGRYTDDARRAIAAAQDIARSHHHHYIGTEHILLGICRQKHSLGVLALQASGVAVNDLEATVVMRLANPSSEVPERLPFTLSGKKTLELTARKALELGHDWVGTEHLLLGLLTTQAGMAAEVLAEYEVRPADTQTEILHLLAQQRSAERGAGPAQADS
ncbi:Clp protease N-terminal domain-containing protein [Nocardia sp. CDC160]|uniref:Clp protease N-terminal domain-containing protein n=1 Tax=Nocardia sp. CDC160 TaxID=3112166 RepID=UPI002DBC6618|nr:Clp protease N-terminal domain-containing protein [Nocardia sp. CDC160]MEC3920271.1 Clp protease N-terminal domain-containing protein [Nocardia sp. CDC160]